MVKLSVIVPVYGVEKYIERCCVSIYEQGYKDFELIFVDDCSKDRSQKILAEVIAKHEHIGIATTVIRHPVNRGISAARETGLNAARGEYVLYVDSDDYIATDMLEQLLGRAEETDADVVFCDFYEVRDGLNVLWVQYVQVSEPRQVVAAMLRQEIKWSPWNKIFKRSIAVEHDIHWPAGINIGEDLVVMTKLLCFANRIEHVNKPLYFYNRDNANSYLNIWNRASCYQNTKAVETVACFLTKELRDPTLLDALVQIKLMARFKLLYAFDDDLLALVGATFPETDDHIFKYHDAPFHWKLVMYLVVVRMRALSWCALRAIWWLKKGRAYLAFKGRAWL